MRLMRILAANLFLLLVCALRSGAAPAEAPLGPLPDTVQPLQYDLTLTVVPAQKRFSGVARIGIRINRECTSFYLHGKSLRVYQASLTLAGGKQVAVRYVPVDAEEGVAKIVAAVPLAPQTVTLVVKYDAPFDDQLEGLYSVQDGASRYAFTQFETIYARQCFPSFDEPAFRAPFDITLIVPRSDAAISNTPVVSETPLKGGLKKVRFARTDPLPTYLLEFAVGPFDVVAAPDIPPSAVRDYPVPLRGVAARGKGENLKYALARIPVFFQKLEDYFGIAYPYRKLDVIAVPDFDYGAMENAAAITFDEYELLLTDDAPVEQAREFALTMTHELSHQWFGDLVTIRWWNDTWLNESFATWMETKIVNEWNPSYRSTLSALEYAVMSMRTDSLQAAHSLAMTVDRGSEAEARFDSIAYAKGGMVLGMFERYLGAKQFQAGIRHYLEKRRFTSATSAEFLADLSEATAPEISKAFETFLYQPGVPLIEASVSCDGKPALELTQTRYLPLGSTADPKKLWQAPVCFRYGTAGAGREKCVLLDEARKRFDLEGAACPEWIMPNAEGAGYYRWSLSPEWYDKLKAPGAALSLPEKMSVADSIQASFAAGRLPLNLTLEALAPFASSDERAIASVPMDVLRFVSDALLPAELAPALRSYAAGLYEDSYRRLGFDPKDSDDDNARLLRSDVLEFLAFVARDPEVIREANRRAIALLGIGSDGKLHPDTVDPNLLGVVLGVGIQENGEPYLQALLRVLKTSKDTAIRDAAISALGSVADPALSPQILSLTFDPVLRTGEAEYPLFFQMRHAGTREAAWTWFRENYDRVIRRIPSADLNTLPALPRRFCSLEKAGEVKAFFEPRLEQLPGGDEVLAESLESITLCASRYGAQSEDARSFFASREATR